VLSKAAFTVHAAMTPAQVAVHGLFPGAPFGLKVRRASRHRCRSVLGRIAVGIVLVAVIVLLVVFVMLATLGGGSILATKRGRGLVLLRRFC